jgi:RNA ligase (TIGR02306 family)
MSTLIVEVCRIQKVAPHANAERLELAHVKGWQCVVPKGKYKAGDKIVYIPPDAVLPVELSDRIGVTKYLSNGRVRCAKLRGEPSFGVVMDLPEDLPEGEDVAGRYGVTKYVPPLRTTAGDAEPEHPLFARYTEIENLRNFPDVIAPGEQVVVTEKIHGTCCRIGYVRDEGSATMRPVAGSKQQQRKIPEDAESFANNLYWYPASLPCVDEMMHFLNEQNHNQVILFGEVYGKVQSLRYGVPNGIAFRAFDLLIDGRYLDYEEFDAICAAYDVPMAPPLYRGPFSLDVIHRHAQGMSELPLADNIREGVVVRPAVERRDPKVGRVILKYIGDAYLLGTDISDTDDQ